MGSSPLARGTHTVCNSDTPTYGLIPARAGNTVLTHGLAPRLRAHPRSRGEHLKAGYGDICGWGSSPLARGTPGVPSFLVRVSGLIPARAGNTFCPVDSFQSTGAHPRSRGEHSLLMVLFLSLGGSSPLARGTPHISNVLLSVIGLIPARAGNTLPPPLMKSSRRAHPRSRGEHGIDNNQTIITQGSSPLARGTPGLS